MRGCARAQCRAAEGRSVGLCKSSAQPHTAALRNPKLRPSAAPHCALAQPCTVPLQHALRLCASPHCALAFLEFFFEFFGMSFELVLAGKS